jgi:hypothetical protein
MVNKQTAVDWVIEQLTPAITLNQKYIDEIKQYAKSIEQEQMIASWEDGFWEGCKEELSGNGALQYYNEQYGK